MMSKGYTIYGEDEENTVDEMKQESSAKGEKMKRTVSQRNLTSQNDDDDAASPKPKQTGAKYRKAKKTASHKKLAASDTLLCCIASKGSPV